MSTSSQTESSHTQAPPKPPRKDVRRLKKAQDQDVSSAERFPENSKQSAAVHCSVPESPACVSTSVSHSQRSSSRRENGRKFLNSVKLMKFRHTHSYDSFAHSKYKEECVPARITKGKLATRRSLPFVSSTSASDGVNAVRNSHTYVGFSDPLTTEKRASFSRPSPPIPHGRSNSRIRPIPAPRIRGKSTLKETATTAVINAKPQPVPKPKPKPRRKSSSMTRKRLVASPTRRQTANKASSTRRQTAGKASNPRNKSVLRKAKAFTEDDTFPPPSVECKSMTQESDSTSTLSMEMSEKISIAMPSFFDCWNDDATQDETWSQGPPLSDEKVLESLTKTCNPTAPKPKSQPRDRPTPAPRQASQPSNGTFAAPNSRTGQSSSPEMPEYPGVFNATNVDQEKTKFSSLTRATSRLSFKLRQHPSKPSTVKQDGMEIAQETVTSTSESNTPETAAKTSNQSSNRLSIKLRRQPSKRNAANQSVEPVGETATTVSPVSTTKDIVEKNSNQATSRRSIILKRQSSKRNASKQSGEVVGDIVVFASPEATTPEVVANNASPATSRRSFKVRRPPPKPSTSFNGCSNDTAGEVSSAAQASTTSVVPKATTASFDGHMSIYDNIGPRDPARDASTQEANVGATGTDSLKACSAQPRREPGQVQRVSKMGRRFTRANSKRKSKSIKPYPPGSAEQEKHSVQQKITAYSNPVIPVDAGAASVDIIGPSPTDEFVPKLKMNLVRRLIKKTQGF